MIKMPKIEVAAEADGQKVSPTGPAFREMAREEFWIVAKSFFAPIYGTYLVWKRLRRLTYKVDRKALDVSTAQPPLQPAE